MKFLCTFLALLWLPWIVSAQVKTHYVTPLGAGSKSGLDWNNAYQGLPATLTRGDSYVLAGGAYTSHTFSDATSGTTYVYIRKAQAGTYNGVAYNDDLVAGWNASFQTTQAVVSGNPEAWTVNTGYYDFDGVTPGSTFPPPTTGQGIKLSPSNNSADVQLLHITGATNVRVQHIAFVTGGAAFDVLQFGLVYENAPNGYVAHNYFVNSQNHIRLAGAQHVIIEYNNLGLISYFSDHHGEQINMTLQNYSSGTPPLDTTIRYNLIDDSGTTNTTGQIIDLTNTGDTNDGVYVYGNLMLNFTGHNGIGSGNSGSPGNLTNWKFYNNTFINSTVDFSRLSTGSEFRNNLLYGSDAEVFAGSAPATRSNNYWNTTINGIGSGSGDVISSESTSVLFQNYAGADYRLGVNSHARNIGFTLLAPYNIDPYGVTRVPGAWDAGTYSSGSGSVGAPAPPANLAATVI